MTDIYKQYEVKGLEDVGFLATWLNANGTGVEKSISMALHPKRKGGTLSFATIDEVVTISLGGDFEEAMLSPLRTALVEQPRISLLTRDLYTDVVDITRFLAKKFRLNETAVFEGIAPNVVGDLRAAASVIGLQANAKKAFRNSADDAYEIALYEPQYSHAIAPYYEKISLPFARLQAESTLFTDKSKVDWFVSYPDAWIRVFTHLSGDPTFSYAITQGGGVIDAMARTLEVTPIQARSLLLWQACGRDMTVMASLFPKEVDNLPAAMPKWAITLDKHYPTLCAATMQMGQAYRDSRSAHTLYGRQIRPGKPEGESTAFRIFGTVEDIVAVAAVTMWQNRLSSDIRVTSIEGGPDAEAIRINGVGPSAGKDFWGAQLKKIAPLEGPVSVGLMPTVVLL